MKLLRMRKEKLEGAIEAEAHDWRDSLADLDDDSPIEHPDESEIQENSGTRSQWALMRMKFFRNKIAVVGGSVIILMYLMIIFADFLCPYDFSQRNVPYKYAPPSKIHWRDEGKRSRPYIYARSSELDLTVGAIIWTEDKTQKYYLRLFPQGFEYKLFGVVPARRHLFGADEGGYLTIFGADLLGRDLYSRILQGGRISLTAGLLGVLISLIIGSVMGAISGYKSGTTDLIVQRIIEFMNSFPRVPIWLAISAALPPSWSSVQIYIGVVTVLGLVGWGGLARAVRAKILASRKNEYVLAAEASGASAAWIMFQHLLPNVTSHLIVSATLAVPGMILAESTLSFLGVGIQPPMTSWGVLLQDAQNIQSVALRPWLLLPGLAIFITVLAFSFLGDGLRDAADPYSNK
jgi:peptide/nickel transport system permease protein